MYNSTHLAKYTIAQLNLELQLHDSSKSIYRMVMVELDRRYKAHFEERILADTTIQNVLVEIRQ